MFVLKNRLYPMCLFAIKRGLNLLLQCKLTYTRKISVLSVRLDY